MSIVTNVSSPVVANQNGWFRYNYGENRLEFVNSETKMVVQVWNIPLDQWENLPSKRGYCENILKQADRVRKKDKNRAILYVIILIVIFLFFGNMFFQIFS